jgi:hypothetical protein
MSRQRDALRHILRLSSFSKAKAIMALITLITLSTLSVRARSYLPALIAEGTPPAIKEQMPAPSQELEEVTLLLRATGFEPAQVTRPAGRFLLSVDNRSGVEELTFEITRADGTKVREIKVLKGNVDWSEEINLIAGQYTLNEAAHPAWVCSITAQ